MGMSDETAKFTRSGKAMSVVGSDAPEEGWIVLKSPKLSNDSNDLVFMIPTFRTFILHYFTRREEVAVLPAWTEGRGRY
jgi:hypothetical protein